MHPEAHATPVTESIWMGGHPPVGPGLSSHGIDALVLAAKEFQPSAQSFPDIDVLHAPMDDDFHGMPVGDKERALNAASWTARQVKRGKTVLVTCWQGRNRSGIITALALLLLKQASPDQAVHLIRAARGPLALSNPHFRKLLLAHATEKRRTRT